MSAEEVAIFDGPAKLGNVPTPYLVWAVGDQFRLGINGMNAMGAAFAGFAVFVQNPVHRPGGAMIDILIEQGGDDGCRSAVPEAFRMQAVENLLLLNRGKPTERTSSFGRSNGLDRSRRDAGWGACPGRPLDRMMELKRGPGDAQSLAGETDASCGEQLQHRAHQDFSSGPTCRSQSKATFFEPP